MGRPCRLFIPGCSAHVIQKGNNSSAIYRQDTDFEVFLAILRRTAPKTGVDVHAFALMNNHVHLLVTPTRQMALACLMQTLGSRYVRYFNRTHQRTGSLWNGRYRSFLIDTERYWLTCLRYVEQNPVRAGLVATPEAYRWSSFSLHASGTGLEWLVPHAAYDSLGATPHQRQIAYRALCGQPLPEVEVTLVENGLGSAEEVSETSLSSVEANSEVARSGVRDTSEVCLTSP